MNNKTTTLLITTCGLLTTSLVNPHVNQVRTELTSETKAGITAWSDKLHQQHQQSQPLTLSADVVDAGAVTTSE